MKKFFITLMCIIMVVCFMPTVAMADAQAETQAETQNSCTGGGGCKHVAAIGDAHYDSLQAAIDAATDVQTVTLLKDIENSSAISIVAGKKIVLDLGKHTLSRTGGGVLDVYGTLEIANGSVVMTGADNGAAMWLNKTANVTVGSDAKIIAKESKSKPRFAVGFWSDCTAASFTLYGEIEGEHGLTINGSIGSGSNNVSIEDGAKINVDGTALYLAGMGETVVKNANITGGRTAIEIRAGELTVNGGTICGNGVPTETAPTPNGNGTTTDGAGIAVAQHTTKLPINVTINGGNISGYFALYESNPQVNDAADIAKVYVDVKGGNFNAINNGTVAVYSQNKTGFITGGTFSSDVIDYMSDDCYEYAMRNGTYIVKASDADKPAFTTGNYWSDSNGKVYTELYSAPNIPTTPTTPTDKPSEPNQSGTTTTTDISNTTTTSNGTTTATVDKTTADKIVDKAVENKSTEVVIDATANTTTAANSTTVAQVTIPTETLGAIAEKTEADVTIKTDVAEVKMDNAAAAAVSEQAEGDTVQIIAEKVAEEADKVEFELKVVCSEGKVISDFNGGNIAVTVALPKAMAEKKVVCVYIDDNGNMSKVEGQKNADGTYTFVTGHFSTYAILSEEEADAAIAAQNEAIKNIKIKVSTKLEATKAGKKGIKVTWKTADGKKLDGVEFFRSVKKNSGYGTKAFFTSKKAGNTGNYVNTKSLKKGTRYYYRARGYVLVDGQKVYTDWSNKGIRTFK